MKIIFTNILARRQLTISIILLIIGFILVTQLRVQSQAGQSLSDQPETDLTEVMDKQDIEIKALRADIAELKIQLALYQNSSKNNADIINAGKVDMDSMRVLLGLDTVAGPGIEIKIADGNGYLTGFDIRQLIEELRASGALSLAINGKRLLANANFSRHNGSVYVNGQRLRIPYNVVALGNPEILYQAITLPRGIKDRLNAFEGVSIKIKKKQRLVLPPVAKVR